MQKDLGEYVKLAEKCIEEMDALQTNEMLALSTFSNVNIEYESMKQLIEDKKNELISTGMVTGKNAEERAANLWVSIAEYDDLQELNIKLIRARTELDIARSVLKLAKDRMSFYSLMIEVLAGLDTNG